MGDPKNEWAERLKDKLAEAADGYRQCIASHQDMPGAYELRDRIEANAEPIDVARVYMLKSLGAVMEALMARPELSEPDGNIFLPLHDLAQALRSLNEGRRTELLETRKGVSRLQHPIEAQRQSFAVVLVEVFEQAGLKNVAARSEVAKILGSAGLVGRKGGPVSAQTLFDWQNQINDEDADGQRRQALIECRKVLLPDEDWKPALNEARRLARAVTASLLLNSQI